VSELILVADDDADILRFVELNLRLEGYEIETAMDGEEALRKARDVSPALAILDVMMPKLDGLEVCQALRADNRTTQMCIIMLTARTMPAEKVLGFTAGADDYIAKPFDPLELVARVKTTLRRTQEMRAISPLTGLPGNIQIENEIQRRFGLGERFAVLWLDLDNFKAFNDRYGFIDGDKAINYLAKILRDITTEDPSTFIGHIGGDDFVMVSSAERAEALCEEVIQRFDKDVKSLYEAEDAERGAIVVIDRLGRRVEYPLISVSLGVATSENRSVTDHRQLVEIATEMKSFAKKRSGSVYAIDRRGRDGAEEPGASDRRGGEEAS
jgi:diguanylate cyclase (GGDEF)-like protein